MSHPKLSACHAAVSASTMGLRLNGHIAGFPFAKKCSCEPLVGAVRPAAIQTARRLHGDDHLHSCSRYVLVVNQQGKLCTFRIAFSRGVACDTCWDCSFALWPSA